MAYSALFAIVPAMLLAAGLTGLVAGDPVRRAQVVGTVAGVFPPLRDLIEAILAEADRDSAPLGIVGAVTLLWGASRFVLGLSEAISRVAGRPTRRRAVVRNGAAILVVLLFIAILIVGPLVAGLASFLDAASAVGVLAVVSGAARLALWVLPPMVAIGVMALVYRVVPTPMPGWRSVGPPAVASGIALSVLLQAFVYLAPRLVGAAALLGSIAAVFVALAWLGLTFQAILLGAAWAGEREAGRSSPG